MAFDFDDNNILGRTSGNAMLDGLSTAYRVYVSVKTHFLNEKIASEILNHGWQLTKNDNEFSHTFTRVWIGSMTDLFKSIFNTDNPLTMPPTGKRYNDSVFVEPRISDIRYHNNLMKPIHHIIIKEIRHEGTHMEDLKIPYMAKFYAQNIMFEKCKHIGLLDLFSHDESDSSDTHYDIRLTDCSISELRIIQSPSNKNYGPKLTYRKSPKIGHTYIKISSRNLYRSVSFDLNCPSTKDEVEWIRHPEMGYVYHIKDRFAYPYELAHM